MPKITKIRLLLLAALFSALAVTACVGVLSSDQDTTPLAGENLSADAEAAYRFTLPSGLQGDVSLDSYAGQQNVVLVFYRGFW